MEIKLYRKTKVAILIISFIIVFTGIILTTSSFTYVKLAEIEQKPDELKEEAATLEQKADELKEEAKPEKFEEIKELEQKADELKQEAATLEQKADELKEEVYPYYELNWFVYVGIGMAAFFILLLYTTVLEQPREYSTLPIFEFFALTILVVSLVLTVALYPIEIFPEDVIIKRTIITDKMPVSTNDQPPQNNVTQWAITIGSTDDENTSGLQIPIYIIVAGSVGAYIRYLYSNIKEMKKGRPKLLKLKQLYFQQKKIVNTLCIAGGLDYEKIRKSEKSHVVRLKHMLKFYEKYRPRIYFLPPHVRGELAKYVSKIFDKLYDVEDEYETKKFVLRSETYRTTIGTICLFFLAPLLAVVAWLFLDLGGTNDWRTYAIVSFSAGLASNSIIKKMWGFVGEKLGTEETEEDEPEHLDEAKPEETEEDEPEHLDNKDKPKETKKTQIT